MNYIQIDKDNLLNGPGIRTVLWTAGCNHACYKCHNPETWDPEAGQYFTETTMNEILQQLSHDYVTGLTITGGDPLYINNRETVAKICKTCKDAYPDKTIWCYTGYKYEEVKNEKAMEYATRVYQEAAKENGNASQTEDNDGASEAEFVNK